MQINLIFGLLVGGSTSAYSSLAGYRFSTVVRNAAQRRALATLMPDDPEQRMLFADFIIKLLSCSPWWPELLRTLDPNNTYDTPVYSGVPTTLLEFNPMQRLMDWESSVTAPTEGRFICSPEDPVIDRIWAKLAATLMAGTEAAN